MPKLGHSLNSLKPQFPAQISRMLQDNFSITTAEEFLGWAVAQNIADVAQTLAVSQRLLDKALQNARRVVDPEFLHELERPKEPYPTGAKTDDDFELPPELARHLQKG
jgi:hypothetical protein